MRFWIVLSALLAFAAALPHTQEQEEILQAVLQYLGNAQMNDGQRLLYEAFLYIAVLLSSLHIYS